MFFRSTPRHFLENIVFVVGVDGVTPGPRFELGNRLREIRYLRILKNLAT